MEKQTMKYINEPLILNFTGFFQPQCGDKTPQSSCRVAVQDKMIETG